MPRFFASKGFLQGILVWCAVFFVFDLYMAITNPDEWSNWFFTVLMAVLFILNYWSYDRRFGK